MKALLIDPRLAGSSGDMFLAALIDLLNDSETIFELVDSINRILNTELTIKINKISKKGIQSSHLTIDIGTDIKSHHATDLEEFFIKILEDISISKRAKQLSLTSLRKLFEAESQVHSESIEKLHLHETASVDTILDIIGFYYLLDKHDLIELPVYGLPVNVGSGFVTFSHGTVSVPPPAVLEILKNRKYNFFSDEVEGELLTPTGAIILATFVNRQISQFPPMNIDKIGKGAGNKEIPSRANILQIMLVDIPQNEEKHYLSMLETHLDDVSGEILGNIIPKLFKKGALDVSYYPLFMKKNRPGWNLRVLCNEEKTSDLSLYIMKELGTLGVRESRFGRYELERRVITKEVELAGRNFICRFKERIHKEEVLGAKPEYEDVNEIAEELNIPIIEVERMLIDKYHGSAGENE